MNDDTLKALRDTYWQRHPDGDELGLLQFVIGQQAAIHTIEAELRKLHDEERAESARHERARAEISRRRGLLQFACGHQTTTDYPDPANGYGGYQRCNHCHKALSR